MKREDQCEDCTWNDQGDCLCGHDVVPFDCPICGFTMYGHSTEEAIELWNEKMDGIHHECNDEME